MFRLVVLAHLLAAGALTIYLTFYWQREQIERRRICGIFAGCVSGPDTNMSSHELKLMCHTHVVTHCTGDQRCCLDCKAAKPLDVSLQQPETMLINFVDTHSSLLVVVGVGISIYVVVYVALLVLRTIENKKRVHTGMLILFGFLWLVVITIYCMSYIISWWHTLKDCQNKLLSLLSWNIVFLLALFDYALYFIPTTARVPFTTLVNVVGGIMLLWWILVGIYLEGVYRGRWLITL